MNIRKIILDELKDKKYTKMEIARYIYIRLGQLLVFDPLYVYGNISAQNRLVYKFVDIENLAIFKIDEEAEYFCFGNEEDVYRIKKIEKEKVYYYDKKYRSSRKEFYL